MVYKDRPEDLSYDDLKYILPPRPHGHLPPLYHLL